MSTALEERKARLVAARKGFIPSTKAFPSAQDEIDVNGLRMFRFKNALSDMTHSEVMDWLHSNLWYDKDLTLLNKFFSTCEEHAISGSTACKWTDGILESAYGIDDPDFRALIIKTREAKINLKLSDVVEGTEAKKDTRLVVFPLEGAEAKDAHLVVVRGPKPSSSLVKLHLRVLKHKTKKYLDLFEITLKKTDDIARIAWAAFAALSTSQGISLVRATRDYFVAFLDDPESFLDDKGIRINDLTSVQIENLCVIKV